MSNNINETFIIEPGEAVINTITGGTFDNVSQTLTLNNSDNTNVEISGFTNFTNSQITTALGYVPYNSSNPSNYISAFTNTFTTGGTYSNGIIQLKDNSGNTVTVAGLYTGSTNQYLPLTGGSVTGQTTIYYNAFAPTSNILNLGLDSNSQLFSFGFSNNGAQITYPYNYPANFGSATAYNFDNTLNITTAGSGSYQFLKLGATNNFDVFKFGYFNGNSQISFITGNTAQFLGASFYNFDNNFAIGTTVNAGYKLDINGTTRLNGNTTIIGDLSTATMSAVTISATTYLNLPSTSGLYLPLSGGTVSGITKVQGTISGSQVGSIAILDTFERPTGTGIAVFNAGAPVTYTYSGMNGTTGADCRIETFGGQGNSGRLSTATSSSLFITAAYPIAAFNPIITANTSTLTWTFNMRNNETSTPSGWGPGSKESGTILFSDNTSLATGGYAGGTGWAVIGVQSASYGFSLVKFTNGLRGTVTPIASFSVAGNGVTQYYSIKVVLTVATGAWTIYVRNDGSAFTNPASGTYINSGSGTDFTYSSGSYPNFAYVYNGTNSNAWWDNFKLVNGSAQLNLYTDALIVSNGNLNQINGFTVLSNLSGVTATNDASAAALGVPLWGLYRNGNIVQIRIV